MVAAGRVPETPLASVQAYVDHMLFGALPRPGGTFDQPAELIEEMRVVASEVNKKRNAERKHAEAELRRARARR
jgi:hypothetical protein